MSRVRENRMHGSMGGSWKRSGQAVETGDLRGAPRGSIDPRRSLIPATSPAPYPTMRGYLLQSFIGVSRFNTSSGIARISFRHPQRP